MKLKSEDHDALSLLFQQDVVPHAIICDNAKEIVFSEFNRKHKEASCHLKQTEPFITWLNAAKKEIKEINKGSGRKFIMFCTQKRLWDDCLELESNIRSNTTHDIYKLDGEVPEMITSGETSDISQFSEFEWFAWMMFQGKTALYSDDHFKLGRCLGLSINIGPAMTAKIIKENYQVFHRSMYQALTKEECE